MWVWGVSAPLARRAGLQGRLGAGEAGLLMGGETREDADRRWSAWMALLAAPWLPRKTAARTSHVSLSAAYLVHAGAAAIVVLVVLATAAARDMRGPLGLRTVVAAMGRVIDDLFASTPTSPQVLAGALVATALGIEAAYAGLAVALAAWGARDETFGESCAHAFRWTWLHTTHTMIAALLLGSLMVPLQRAGGAWFRANVAPLATPLRTSFSSEAVARYYQKLTDLHASRPWYLKRADEMVGVAFLVLGTWVLRGLLVGLGTHRRTDPVEPPPLCDACGYNLTGLDLDQRCPECGEPILASIGPAARPGVAWERLDRWRAWPRCWLDAMVRPRWFGRQMRVWSGRGVHRWVLLAHAALMGLFVAAAIYLDDPSPPSLGKWVGLALAAWLTAAVALIAITLAAGLVATRYWIRDRTNLLPGTMQAASYSAGHAALGLVAWLIIVCWLIRQVGWITALATLTGRAEWELYALIAIGPAVFWIIAYLRLLLRIASGLRFASR